MIEEFNVDLKAEWSYLAPHVARKKYEKEETKTKKQMHCVVSAVLLFVSK